MCPDISPRVQKIIVVSCATRVELSPPERWLLPGRHGFHRSKSVKRLRNASLCAVAGKAGQWENKASYHSGPAEARATSSGFLFSVLHCPQYQSPRTVVWFTRTPTSLFLDSSSRFLQYTWHSSKYLQFSFPQRAFFYGFVSLPFWG